MTPSENTHHASGESYRNIWAKVFTTDMNPYPCINGLRDVEKAKTAWNEANKCNVDDSVKSDVKAVMQSLRDD